jgi:hypothetical protein
VRERRLQLKPHAERVLLASRTLAPRASPATDGTRLRRARTAAMYSSSIASGCALIHNPRTGERGISRPLGVNRDGTASTASHSHVKATLTR